MCTTQKHDIGKSKRCLHTFSKQSRYRLFGFPTKYSVVMSKKTCRLKGPEGWERTVPVVAYLDEVLMIVPTTVSSLRVPVPEGCWLLGILKSVIEDHSGLTGSSYIVPILVTFELYPQSLGFPHRRIPEPVKFILGTNYDTCFSFGTLLHSCTPCSFPLIRPNVV